MEPGTRVRMSQALKAKLMKACTEEHHVGPFDPEDVDKQDCWGCSYPHVLEFGACEGIVEGPMDFNTCKPGEAGYDPAKVGPEVDVRWQPSKLRYGYHPDDLDRV